MTANYQIPVIPNFTIWRWTGLCGYFYSVTILMAWAGVAGFLPPPYESLNVTENYQYYMDNSFRIRLGMMLTLVVTPLYYVWASMVSRTMEYVEGPRGTLSKIQLMGAFGTVVVTWGSCAGWLAAAFDVGSKSPEAIKTLTDYSWMWFNATVIVSFTQFIAFGIICLIDKNEVPLFPRWLGWFSLAMGFSLMLALFTPFFRTGPFSWHGLFCYYIGLGDFFIWILLTTHYVLKAVKRIEQESLTPAL